MNKIREKLQRFMIGRYGMDQLGQFIMYAVLVLIFLNVVVRVRILSSFLYILELAGFFLLYFRMFSKMWVNATRRIRFICACGFM